MAAKYPGVEPHGSGLRLYFQFQGKRRREPLDLAPTTGNMKYAAKMVKDIKRQLRAGTFDYGAWFPESGSPLAIDQSVPTFGRLAERWLKTLGDPSSTGVGMAYSTRVSYERILRNYYYPHLEGRALDGITYLGLLEVVNGHPWRSVTTRNNSLIPLRSVFRLAFEEGYIERNPADRIKSLKRQAVEPDPFTVEEVDVLLGWLEVHRPQPIFNYFEFMFFSGLRPSESMALRWGDVDLFNGRVKVSKGRVWGQFNPHTKNYRARGVELNARSLAAINRQRTHTQLAGNDVWINPGTGTGFRFTYQLWRPFESAIKGTGLRYRAPYQTRHTYATMCLMVGANPFWVSQQLGHSSLNTTLTYYARWIPGGDKGSELGKVNAHLTKADQGYLTKGDPQ